MFRTCAYDDCDNQVYDTISEVCHDCRDAVQTLAAELEEEDGDV